MHAVIAVCISEYSHDTRRHFFTRLECTRLECLADGTFFTEEHFGEGFVQHGSPWGRKIFGRAFYPFKGEDREQGAVYESGRHGDGRFFVAFPIKDHISLVR